MEWSFRTIPQYSLADIIQAGGRFAAAKSTRLRSKPLATDEQHVALPKLYGAPAYARPPRIVDDSARPFNPDDLPIEAEQTEEDRALVRDQDVEARDTSGSGRGLQARPFLLRALAGRLLRET